MLHLLIIHALSLCQTHPPLLSMILLTLIFTLPFPLFLLMLLMSSFLQHKNFTAATEADVTCGAYVVHPFSSQLQATSKTLPSSKSEHVHVVSSYEAKHACKPCDHATPFEGLPYFVVTSTGRARPCLWTPQQAL